MSKSAPVYARRIGQFRRDRNLSQERLAELMEVEQPTVQRWESGKREVTASRIMQLAEALKVPAHAFFLDDDAAKQFVRAT